VDVAVAEGDVLANAVERAATLAAKASPVLGVIKTRMYAPALTALRDTEAKDLTLDAIS
jgi:hypothetical protein